METNTTMNGYLALPQAGTGKGPGVLVMHAWWGLNAIIKAVCDRLAAQGYVAYAPDLYHGQIATTIEEAGRLGHQLEENVEQAKAEARAGLAELLSHLDSPDQGVAVMGFSLGAFYSAYLSGVDPEHVRAVVLFYGVGAGDFKQAKAAYLAHFAEKDDYESDEWIGWFKNEVTTAGRALTTYTYEGAKHWFFERDRPDAYDEAAANLAWERTLAFLRAQVG